MYTEEKVWSIEIGDQLEVAAEDPKRAGASATAKRTGRQPRLVVRQNARVRPASGKNPPHRLHFALLLPLTYLLGPLAILLTPEGRRRRDWVVTGLVMGAGWLGVGMGWRHLLGWLVRGVAEGPILVGLATLVVGGFSVWSLAVYLAGSANRPPDHRLPLPLRRAWGALILGFLVPGAGLLAAGRPRRAAAALWLAWIPLAAFFLLRFGPAWHSVRQGTIDPGWEKILLTAAGLVACGMTGWLIQALDGARLVPWDGQRYHRSRGDILGLAAVLGMVALAVFADPSPVARNLGRQARYLHAEGYRLVPLVLLRSAATLDPGRTDYTVVSLEIYDELGWTDRAVAARERLEHNLASYLALREREESPAAAFGLSFDPDGGKRLPALADPSPGWNLPAYPWRAVAVVGAEEPAPGSGSR